MLSRIILLALFVAVPALEIALFILVGERIGVLATVLLVFATAFAGMTLARRQGFDTLQRLRAQVEQNKVPGEEIGNAVTIVIAGILLLVPGFFTDALGLLLFVPAVRRRLWRSLKARLGPSVVVVGPGGGPAGPPPGPGGGGGAGPVIDLDEEEFGPAREDTPWRPPSGDRLPPQR